ncbi:MAG: ABC transporter substrate-binding protein [Clostridia bacterium]|nr:ABC transporter substrate-binding protein [Clostridia bacterium]
MKTAKRIIALLLVLAMAFSVAVCAVSAEETKETTHKITDHFGNEVEVPYEVNRVVVCNIYPLPSVITIFFDSAEKLVGIAPASMTAAQNSLLGELYPEILKASTTFTDGTDCNIEEVMALQPDVVFYGASDKAFAEKLAEAGIPALGFSVNKWDYDSIETLNNWIDLLSQVFPENDKTEIVKKYSDETYKMVQDRVKDLKDEEKRQAFVLFNYNDTAIATSGAHFFGQWWLDAIGAVNVANEIDKDNAAPVSMEQIYGWNPDLIFITNFTQAKPEDLYENKIGTNDWSEIEAVKTENCYKMPLGMYRSYTPGVDTPITLMWLAKQAYPELFEDIDITAETVKYYEEVFGVKLTDEQAEQIFTPVTSASAVFDKK